MTNNQMMDYKDKEKPYTVSQLIGLINERLSGLGGVVVGEISQFKIAASGHAYFDLKDKDTGDILSCIMWKWDYRLGGVELEMGMEIVASGHLNFYGPYGKLSLNVKTAKLVGEGALKKAYEKLKKKLDGEGLFDESRKKPLPELPQKIAVVTSVHGAVIHDFSNNLRQSGFKVKILDCRVEGPESGRPLALSVRALRGEDIDVLVLLRGGGSLQSLAGFNNEALVREIADFPVPVIAGIGHDEDKPLAALVADAAESTPSLVAALLNSSWERASQSLEKSQYEVMSSYESAVVDAHRLLSLVFSKAKGSLDQIFAIYRNAKQSIKSGVQGMEFQLSRFGERFKDNSVALLHSYGEALDYTNERRFVHFTEEIKRQYGKVLQHTSGQLEVVTRLVIANDPNRQLRMGYSLVRRNGKLVRNVQEVSVGEEVDIKLSNGSFLSEVKDILK